MKNKIVLVPFPFDDLTATKVRPAVCLTREIMPHKHVVLAFITSKIPVEPCDTDLILENTGKDFAQTGLKVSSTIRLHRLMTVTTTLIRRQLGELSTGQRSEVEECLRKLFEISS